MKAVAKKGHGQRRPIVRPAADIAAYRLPQSAEPGYRQQIRHQRNDARNHHGREHHAEQDVLAQEVHAGESVGGGDAEEQRADDADARDAHAIPDIPAKIEAGKPARAAKDRRLPQFALVRIQLVAQRVKFHRVLRAANERALRQRLRVILELRRLGKEAAERRLALRHEGCAEHPEEWPDGQHRAQRQRQVNERAANRQRAPRSLEGWRRRQLSHRRPAGRPPGSGPRSGSG